MRKTFLTMLLAVATGMTGLAQEKMTVEFKNGNVVSYNVEDLNRFYFVTEEPIVTEAANCGIAINDEMVLTTQFAIDFTYESELENILLRVYAPEANVGNYTDEELVADMTANGVLLSKSTTLVTAGNMPEGQELTLVYTGLNAAGQHGHVYRHQLTTHTKAAELLAPVTSFQYTDTQFRYKIEIDDEKVLKYYLFEEMGNNVEIANNLAEFAMLFKRAIEADSSKGQYYLGEEFTTNRNGATQCYIVTWAIDFNLNYSGNLFQGFYDVANATRGNMVPAKARATKGQMEIKGYNLAERLEKVKGIKYRVIQKRR